MGCGLQQALLCKDNGKTQWAHMKCSPKKTHITTFNLLSGLVNSDSSYISKITETLSPISKPVQVVLLMSATTEE
jgi:hypothetical protein